nr:hypothetical protein [Tanacetum cinerariifolium]
MILPQLSTAYMASTPQIEYAPIAYNSSEFSSPKTGLVVPVFQKGDDPIDAINHMISFLTSVVASRPFASGSGETSRKQRVIVCYNCKWEGHMSKQCTKPKRKRDAEWFKDKVLLVQAQANGQVLQEEELDFLADLGTTESSSNQTVITTNAAYQGMTWMLMIWTVMNSTQQSSDCFAHSEEENRVVLFGCQYDNSGLLEEEGKIMNSNFDPGFITLTLDQGLGYTVISDSEDSAVTYIEVSSPFEGLSDIGSPGVDGLPMMPKDPYAYVVAALHAPPSPDYVPSLEHPPSLAYAPKFVLEPVYPEFMSLEDDVLLAEEQPLPAADSPTANSLGYIPESGPEEDDEDLEEDPADYPTDRDDDDEEEESSGDEEDDEDNNKGEEHPTPTDSIPPPLVHHTTTRISILVQAPTPFWSEAEIDRLLAIPSPPPSPLSPWSSSLPQIPSQPLPVSPPLHVSSPPLPASPTYPLGYRVAMIQLRVETPSTSHPLPSSTPPLLPIPLPTSSPPFFYPLRAIEQTFPRPTGGFKADYGFVATLDDEIRRDLERDLGYGITDTWDDMLVGMLGEPATDETELGRRMTDFVTTVRQDTEEIYERLDDA